MGTFPSWSSQPGSAIPRPASISHPLFLESNQPVSDPMKALERKRSAPSSVEIKTSDSGSQPASHWEASWLQQCMEGGRGGWSLWSVREGETDFLGEQKAAGFSPLSLPNIQA